MSSKTVLILGIAGVSLAAAMYFDSMNNTVDDKMDNPKRGGSPRLKLPPPTVTTSVFPQGENIGPSKLAKSKTVHPVKKTTSKVTPKEEKWKKMYLKKKEREERRHQEEEINMINQDAYTGDWSDSSRRLYLQKMAYKRSREQTPIIPFAVVKKYRSSRPRGYEEDEDEDDDELVEILEEMEKKGSDERPPSPTEKSRVVSISKESWETRDPVVLNF